MAQGTLGFEINLHRYNISGSVPMCKIGVIIASFLRGIISLKEVAASSFHLVTTIFE